MDEISAVGHRIVQGAEVFNKTTLVTDEVIQKIDDLAELAPVHNHPHALALWACKKVIPETVPQAVVFDTAFHQTMPEKAFMFGMPYECYEKYHVRKYGFHGTSHRFVTAALAEKLGKDIKDLKIPFKAVATDLYTGEEIVYTEGKLFEAIRASISIPSLFRPVKQGLRTLIDGGIVNTLPISQVDRNGKDILIAFDVNDVDVTQMHEAIVQRYRDEQERLSQEKARKEDNRLLLDSIRNNDSLTFSERMKLVGIYSKKLIAQSLASEGASEFELGDSYYSILDRTFSLMNHTISELTLQLYKPDIVVRMPFDAYGEISDYTKAKEISKAGRELMREALDKWEK